jgi:hypothetical protein
MNDETCKCYECNTEIPANMGFTVSRVSRFSGKVFYMDLCDDCWYIDGDGNVHTAVDEKEV